MKCFVTTSPSGRLLAFWTCTIIAYNFRACTYSIFVVCLLCTGGGGGGGGGGGELKQSLSFNLWSFSIIIPT